MCSPIDFQEDILKISDCCARNVCETNKQWCLRSRGSFSWLEQRSMRNVSVPSKAADDYSSSIWLQFVYHVIYIASYQMPVFYFAVSTLDGQKIDDLDVILDIFSKNGQSQISQAEHPILGYPCYMLHPCKSEAVVGELRHGTRDDALKNFVLSWLTIFGPLIGANIPLELISLLN